MREVFVSDLTETVLAEPQFFERRSRFVAILDQIDLEFPVVARGDDVASSLSAHIAQLLAVGLRGVSIVSSRRVGCCDTGGRELVWTGRM